MTSHQQDESAREAVELFKGTVKTDPERMRWSSYQDIVQVCRRYDELDAWASHFTHRYLDFSPLIKESPQS